MRIYILFTMMHGQDIEFIGAYEEKENAEKEMESLISLNRGSKAFGCCIEELEVRDF